MKKKSKIEYEICCDYFRDVGLGLKMPLWCNYCYSCGQKIIPKGSLKLTDMKRLYKLAIKNEDRKVK